MTLRAFIPNLITLANLAFGLLAIEATFYGGLDLAFYYILAGAAMDFLDGFVARLLKVNSAIGVQLDSLADIVTFGVAPAFLAKGILASFFSHPDWASNLVFLIPIFSAWRLAKFNISENQHTSFTGMPTPANALFIGGWVFYYSWLQNTLPYQWTPWAMNALFLICAFWLVWPMKLMSLKFKSFGWTANKWIYLFLISCAIVIFLTKEMALPPIIILYIFVSLTKNE